MPEIKTDDLLEKIAKGNFKVIKLRALQRGQFCMMLECDDGTFIHYNKDGSLKEYPKVDNALTWLKRMTDVDDVIVDIALWTK